MADLNDSDREKLRMAAFNRYVIQAVNEGWPDPVQFAINRLREEHQEPACKVCGQ